MSFLARETVGFCLNAHAGPTFVTLSSLKPFFVNDLRVSA